jgi:hypothetical protein
MQEVIHNFVHVPSRENNLIMESYCLICHVLVSSGAVERTIVASEQAHRIVCPESSSERSPYAGQENTKAPRKS